MYTYVHQQQTFAPQDYQVPYAVRDRKAVFTHLGPNHDLTNTCTLLAEIGRLWH